MVMEYRVAEINGLHDNLHGFQNQLKAAGDAVESAGAKLGQAWQGNAGHEGFLAAYTPWKNEYEQALAALERIKGGVLNSVGNAMGADNHVRSILST